MNTVLTPPPERELPPAARRRRRAELVALVADERPRRRFATPLLAAASVAAVTVGLAVAVPALRDSGTPDSRQAGTPDPAGQGPAGTASAAQPRRPAPPAVHDLTASERVAFFERCRKEFDQPGAGWPERFGDYRPVAGLRFTGKYRGGIPAAWLITEKEGQYWICIEDSRGQFLGNAGFGPRSVKDVPYLFAPVDGRGAGTGPVTRPVVRVTVQGKGTGEQEAAIRHGFWFAPFDDQRYVSWDEDNRPAGDNNLIGVPPGYTFRGYDAAGRLVYDSSRSGPDVRRCYTDPAGREVIVHNGVAGGHPDPATCRRTLTWHK